MTCSRTRPGPPAWPGPGRPRGYRRPRPHWTGSEPETTCPGEREWNEVWGRVRGWVESRGGVGVNGKGKDKEVLRSKTKMRELVE